MGMRVRGRPDGIGGRRRAAGGCCKLRPGMLDCAPWQKNHRPDMLKDAELEKSGLA